MTKQDFLDQISTKIDLITSGADVIQAEVVEIDKLFKAALQKENRDFHVFAKLMDLFSKSTITPWLFALHPLIKTDMLEIYDLLCQYQGRVTSTIQPSDALQKQIELHCSCSCQHMLKLCNGDLVAVESKQFELWKNPPNTVLTRDDINTRIPISKKEVLVFLGTEKVCQRFPSELNLSNTYEVSKWLVSSTNQIAYSKLSNYEVTKSLRKIKNV